MTESKIGLRLNLTSAMSASVSRGIVMWPGGNLWRNTATRKFKKSDKIKPVKTIDAEVDIHGFEISYQTAETTSNTYTEAPSYEMWSEYIHVQHTPREVGKHYRFNFEYGYWKSTGRHFDFNLSYQFDQSILGTLKAYNFKTFRSYEPFIGNYGIIGIVQIKFTN